MLSGRRACWCNGPRVQTPVAACTAAARHAHDAQTRVSTELLISCWVPCLPGHPSFPCWLGGGRLLHGMSFPMRPQGRLHALLPNIHIHAYLNGYICVCACVSEVWLRICICANMCACMWRGRCMRALEMYACTRVCRAMRASVGALTWRVWSVICMSSTAIA